MKLRNGETSGKVLKLLSDYLQVDEKQISSETGFTESSVQNFFKSDVLPKDYTSRMLVAMRLTQSDLTWINIVLTEIREDRDKRVAQIEAMRKEIKLRERKIELEYRQKEVEAEEKRKANKARSRSESRSASGRGDKDEKVRKKRKVLRKVKKA